MNRLAVCVLTLAGLALAPPVLAQEAPAPEAPESEAPAPKGPARATGGVVVIVNPQAPVRSLSRKELQRIFKKKTILWEGGGKIWPVDQVSTSPARKAFSEQVLGRSVEAMRQYWQAQIFSGRHIPPTEESDDGAVVDYVANRRGGIGYVSKGTPLAGTVVLEVTD